MNLILLIIFLKYLPMSLVNATISKSKLSLHVADRRFSIWSPFQILGINWYLYYHIWYWNGNNDEPVTNFVLHSFAIHRIDDGNATTACSWLFWYYIWRSSAFTVIDWRHPIIMSTYYLAFRPYAELRSICQSPSAPSSLLLARSGWSNAGVYRAGPETDFFSFASGLSLEVQKMGAEINKCLSSKTSSTSWMVALIRPGQRQV